MAADATIYSSFFTAATYENFARFDVYPINNDPFWILGVKYSLLVDWDKLDTDIQSRPYFTYRKGFRSIGDSGLTSDVGWGCMLRCGQMMLAQALICRHLTRGWRWKRGRYDPKYFEILRLFQDKCDSCFSIHQIACMGVSEGKYVGEWFGPNTVMQVLRRLAEYDRWSGIVVHVAMDSTIVVDDIRSRCVVTNVKSSDECFVAGSNVQSVILSAYQSAVCRCHAGGGADCNCTDTQQAAAYTPRWKPLLLIVPLRLGLADVNEMYFSALKTCFTFKQSVGMIGGRPNHAHWFIGFNGDRLYFLDPHTVQPFTDLSYSVSDESFHSQSAASLDISQLDPSVAIGFYCDSAREFDNLCDNIRTQLMSADVLSPLFEVQQHKMSSASAVSDLPSTTQMSDWESEYEIL